VADAASTRKLWLIRVLLAVAVVDGVACWGIAAYHTFVPWNGIEVEQVRANLDEDLPDGSSWEQAHEWFATHGIKPDYIVESDGRRIGLMKIIPNSSLLENAHICIELYFDDNGKLQKRMVRRHVVSL
jgi:hypothetical protein